MKIVFMGTPEFAVPSLELLIREGYALPAVVTAPDKPRGRGQRISSTPVKECALRHHLTILQPERLDDPAFIESLQISSPDLIVVVAFRILPSEVFKVPLQGTFNLHASLLPRYRGAAPINWAIINGEYESGVTTFFLKEKVDTGDVILQARVAITETMTAGELHDILAEVGAEIVLQTVRLIEQGKAKPIPQEHAEATPAPKIFRDDCRIRWENPPGRIHNFIRGLSPLPTAWTMHGETILKIYRSRISGAGQGERKPGCVHVHDGRLEVSAGGGTIEITEIQQEGKKRLGSEEFLRGYRLEEGDFLV